MSFYRRALDGAAIGARPPKERRGVHAGPKRTESAGGRATSSDFGGSDHFNLPSALCWRVFLWAAGASQLVRLSGWGSLRAVREAPFAGVLHLGYVLLGLGLLLEAGFPSAGRHLLSLGGIGLLCLAMMAPIATRCFGFLRSTPDSGRASRRSGLDARGFTKSLASRGNTLAEPSTNCDQTPALA